MGLIKDKLIKNGLPVAGALTVLVDKKNDKDVDQVSTDKNGTYRFDNVAPGKYEIRFYGSGTTKDDWIEEIIIPPDDMVGMEPLFFSVEPLLHVSEGVSDTDVNGAEFTQTIISISNINITQGKIVAVEIFYKKSEDSDYEKLTEYRPQVDSPSSLTFNASIYLDKKPVYYDFKAYFYNGNGDLGKVGSTVVESKHLKVLFNGIPELYEYIEVPDLHATNTENPYHGILPNAEIDLEWTDLRKLAVQDKYKPSSEQYYPIETSDAFGNPLTLTRAMAEKIQTYGLYMYVSFDGSAPAEPHPGVEALYNAIRYNEVEWDYVGYSEEGSKNMWVFIGEFATANAPGIRCPRNTTVYFWCGAKTYMTETKIETQKLSY